MPFTRNLLATVAATTLAMVAVAPASAKIVNVKYTGTVESGFDTTGLFGTANTDLSGKTFVATYKFDDALGYTSNNTYYGENYAYGGSSYGNASPSLGASIMIGGHSVSLSGASFAQIYGRSEKTFSQQYHNAADYTSSGSLNSSTYLYNTTYSDSGALPGAMGALFSGIGEYSNGYFEKYEYDYSNYTHTTHAYANLKAGNLSISGAVPEPATWSMLILGFGVVGGTMRSAKRKSARIAYA